MVILVRVVAVPMNFTWAASLNRDTGIATSREKSSARYSDAALVDQKEIARLAESIFVGYPGFLATPSLTLGLLRAHNKSSGKQYSLCTSICDLNLLTFGPPKVTSNTIFRKLARNHKGAIICSLEIPVIGGLLSQSSESNISSAKGCLRFTLIRETKNRHDRVMNTLLVTEIAGPYRPSIAGKAKPRSMMRSALYCGTQRIFHEYVMWRFHRLFRRELGRTLNESCLRLDDRIAQS